jgi:hypothetical protein
MQGGVCMKGLFPRRFCALPDIAWMLFLHKARRREA